MKIGIVVHGPYVVDSGYALKIINLLNKFGEVKCRLGGTMGRTAVIDASLENIIDISSKLLPSESVKLFKKEDVDVIFLLNYGKSSITGHTFGAKVFKNSYLSPENEKKYFESLDINFNNNYDNTNTTKNSNNPNNYKLNEKSLDTITFIQIERPGEEDGSVIEWSRKSSPLVYEIASALNLRIVKSETIIKKHFSNELNGSLNKLDDCIPTENSFKLEKAKKIRNIKGVNPNENIFVNGVVIGKSCGEKLLIIAKNGYIVDIIGGTIKPHGIEKLGKIDIDKAIIKTGLLRRSTAKPRIINNDTEANLPITDNFSKNYLKIAFLDHAAEDIYNLKNTDLVVTIGDDTTLVASDILFRFNIPVIGITDGDLDKVVEKGFKAEGSMIIEVKQGFDDIVGKSIFKKLFNSKKMINIDLNIDKDNFLNKTDLKIEKIEDFKNQIFDIVNTITSKYKIKE